MASEGFITESQRHFGVNGIFIGDDDLRLAFCLAFGDMRKNKSDHLVWGWNQQGKVFDVLGHLQKQRATHFFLHQRIGSLQQACPRCNRIARKMHLVDWMLWVEVHLSLKAVFGLCYGFYDEKVVQEIHGRAQNFNAYKTNLQKYTKNQNGKIRLWPRVGTLLNH